LRKRRRRYPNGGTIMDQDEFVWPNSGTTENCNIM
jgi:hypothetical protein